MGFENDIYVSYAPDDYERVKPVLADLSARLAASTGRQYSFWIDQKDIRPGMNWRDEIRRGLQGSRAMLAFLSPSYALSEAVWDEVDVVYALQRPIFPILLEEPGNNVPIQMRRMNWFRPPTLPLERSEPGYETFIDSLSKRIVEILGVDRHGVAPQPTDEKNSAKGYVFLSYAEEDSDFLEQLRSFFGEQGYAYWEFEKSDRDYQKRIDLELESVINNAVATVSVLSDSWKSSDWAVRELYFSQEIGKPVFLLKAKPFKAILAISGLPYIDFTRDSEQAFVRLARELKRAGL